MPCAGESRATPLLVRLTRAETMAVNAFGASAAKAAINRGGWYRNPPGRTGPALPANSLPDDGERAARPDAVIFFVQSERRPTCPKFTLRPLAGFNVR